MRLGICLSVAPEFHHPFWKVEKKERRREERRDGGGGITFPDIFGFRENRVFHFTPLDFDSCYIAPPFSQLFKQKIEQNKDSELSLVDLPVTVGLVTVSWVRASSG